MSELKSKSVCVCLEARVLWCSQKLVNQNCVQHDTLYIVYLFSHVELEKEEKTRADDDRTSVTLRRLMGLFMTFFCNEKPHFFPNLSSFERVSASKKGLRQMVSQVLNHAAWTSKKGRAERRTSITEQFVTYITIIRLSFMQLSKQSRKNQFLIQFIVTFLE